MKKSRLIYLVLLLIAAAFVIQAAASFKSNEDLDQAQRSIILKEGSNYILNVDLYNDGEAQVNYTISIFLEGKRYDEKIGLGSGKQFTYVHYIYPPFKNNKVEVNIFKNDISTPLSKATYILE